MSAEYERPIRVLHIITRMIQGGAQENTLLTVEGLNRTNRFRATLVSGMDHGPEGELLSRVRTNTPLVVVPQLGRAISPSADFAALVKLYRIIREGRYHIVHTHSSKAGVLGRIAAKLAATPFIVHTLHGLAFHEYQPRMLNWLFRNVKKTCAHLTDQFISVSSLISQTAINAGIAPAEKFTTIYSGMELEWFLHATVDPAQIRRELGIPPDAPVVGKVARLFPLKGHAQLLEAAPEIVRRHPTVRFLLVGDGILQEELRKSAREKRILENFVFAGLMPRERIPDMISVMDVVVHTSLREGLARVLPQALAMGKPCVSFELDGSPEVVLPGQTGFLVKPGDTSGLADAITRLLSDPDLRKRMGTNGRRLVDPAFRAETMVERTAAVYNLLLQRYPERLHLSQ
jgi:glycosyltransferase involved in cell wall biosynthesis